MFKTVFVDSSNTTSRLLELFSDDKLVILIMGNFIFSETINIEVLLSLGCRISYSSRESTGTLIKTKWRPTPL